MNLLPFIPKDSPDFPEGYSVAITFHDGKSQSYELVEHVIKRGIFTATTKEDQILWIPIVSVRTFEFDKRFSKLMALRAKKG